MRAPLVRRFLAANNYFRIFVVTTYAVQHKPRGNTRVATTVPQMPVKTTTTTAEQQTSQAKTSTESQNPVQKREKKMRKKRKMIRQKVEGESSTSSSESDVVQQALVNSMKRSVPSFTMFNWIVESKVYIIFSLTNWKRNQNAKLNNQQNNQHQQQQSRTK